MSHLCCCNFAADQRVYDVSYPYYIKELGYFIPPHPLKLRRPMFGPLMTITVEYPVDDNDKLFINTSIDGMYVVRIKDYDYG